MMGEEYVILTTGGTCTYLYNEGKGEEVSKLQERGVK